MAKSDKATMLRRIQDVLRLLLAGAEFADIRQFASDQGWQVSDRQVRRYMEASYKRLAKASRRNHEELLGRHLMQRRALYARCLKEGDWRTALAVLRDEAELQTLYAPSKAAPTTPAGRYPYPGHDAPLLTRQVRVARLLNAQAKEDKTEMQLIEHASPLRILRVSDTMLPLQMLHIAALLYTCEQLEQAGMLFHAMWCAWLEDEKDGGEWNRVGLASAYRFRVGGEAWKRFVNSLNVDGDYLVRSNFESCILDVCGEAICDISPSADELREVMSAAGHPVDKLVTADALYRQWQKLFAQVAE